MLCCILVFARLLLWEVLFNFCVLDVQVVYHVVLCVALQALQGYVCVRFFCVMFELLRCVRSLVFQLFMRILVDFGVVCSVVEFGVVWLLNV